MNYPYIIIDDVQESVLKTKAIADSFSELVFVASANNYSDGLNLILEHSPKLIFLEIDPADITSNLSLALINELYRYLKVIPKIIITTNSKDMAFQAIQYEVADYILKPLNRIDIIKSILKIKKSIEENEVSIDQNQIIKRPDEFKLKDPKSSNDFKVSTGEVILVPDDGTDELLAEQPQSNSLDTPEEVILVPDANTNELLAEQSQSDSLDTPEEVILVTDANTDELLAEQSQSDSLDTPEEVILVPDENTDELVAEQSQSDSLDTPEEVILVPDANTHELVAEQPQSHSLDTTEEAILVLDETQEQFDEKIPEIIVEQVIPVVEQPLILCIKSYGDYRYIDANDICYFQADNNSTDIHLNNGEMVTAFKTLKHFEGVLPHPFSRIHNSYIVNRDYISRIHTGNAICYIKNTTTKLPFSKSYKENVDLIISEFANGNYLEI
jgi:DNA-binding LytR/AlgR family response regulator